MQRSRWRFAAALAGLALVCAPAVLAAGKQIPSPTGQKRPKAAISAPATAGYAVLERSCFKCHGESSRLSDLDLRTRELALKGGKHGPAVAPGSPEKSRLYRMVTGHAKPQMPPTAPLSDRDLKTVKAWIEAGAPYPASASAGGDGKWWAFRPVKQPEVPRLNDPWVRNPVDAFLLARMKTGQIRPNPAADRLTLVRRAYFDLHGLPPTPEEVDQFVNDRSPDAWEKLVDRLLASPQYGERWARHWLDLARYAESEGFKADETRPNAWRYRDYVIESLNADKPYDRFIKEQLAGDELYPGDHAALVATGFNRHWADESNARNIALRRQEILNDITDVTTGVFLGLTVGCARCHDHKYDPIPQKDYYRIQAFFAAVQPRDDLVLAPATAQQEYQARLARWQEETEPVRARLATLEAPVRSRLVKEKRMPFTDEVQDAIDTPPARRTALQWQLFLKVEPQIQVKSEDVGKALKGDEKKEWEALQAEMAKFVPQKPSELPLAIGLTDIGREAPKVHTLAVGNYDSPIEEVQPGFLSALTTAAPRIQAPADRRTTGRRSALAEWIVSAENPLTARVMVNRLFQGHFGRGIVPTASDFGKSGELPTHPELLDWLASEFIRSGWSMKHMHRLLMTSSAYRQSSALNPQSLAKDPQETLFWRYRRWRLEGEAVRDACLSVSGELNPKMGGPSIFPELPEGVSTRGGWDVTKDVREQNRRSVYVFVRRNLRYPLFEAFDFPDTHEPCSRRVTTNTAPQALMLFNSSLALKRAQAMAGRLLRESDTPEGRVDRAYRLAFGRAPETAERDLSLQFMKRQQSLLGKRLERKEAVALPVDAPQSLDPAEGAALVDFCHALMNTNEFLYVD